MSLLRSNTRQLELRKRAAEVIPGGMYGHESTRMLPAEFPQFFERTSGARMWDVDGNEYVDYMCAYGPNLLGYNFAPVRAAADAQADLCDTGTGPAPVMVELAEAFVGMVSFASWAMFCKNGSDATSMALVLARAHTGRRKVLLARGAYHGSSIWNTPQPAGILPEDRAHIVYFDYNDPESLSEALKANAGDVAGVFATPFRHEAFADQTLPDAAYARAARDLCDEHGALLIVDDVRASFRITRDCSWAALGVEPDLAAFGKSFANGYPISALLGAEKVREAASKIFVTGSFWFQAAPMAAAVETLRQIRETDYLERINAAGQRLRDGLQQQGARYGFTLRQTGPVSMPQILFQGDPDFRVGYGFVTECIRRGVYFSPYHNMFLSAAHGDEDIKFTLSATDDAFAALAAGKDALQPHPIVAALRAR